MSSPPVAFGRYVAERAAAGSLVVQPRLGFATTARMRAALQAVRRADADTVGTLTLDSYTRVNDHAAAARALAAGKDLNGFPLVAHGADRTRGMLAGLAGPGFPVQVRHGSAQPLQIFQALLDSGLDATEGGPVSYCLPYSRVPLRQAVAAWAECCRLLADGPGDGRPGHLESFAGCMLGQLCPPGLLVALGVLEGLFARAYGVRSLSLSYSQQVHAGQDAEALRALRALATEFLPDVDVHLVVYTFMGLFPRTPAGSAAILRDSVDLARAAGAERLIVKTAAEAMRIPTVGENVEALESAAARAREVPARRPEDGADLADNETYAEARTLVEAVLDLHPDVGTALVTAFARGLLDVPYCLHPDTAQRARARIAPDGRLRWSDPGRMPLPAAVIPAAERLRRVGSAELLQMLSHNQRAYDGSTDTYDRVTDACDRTAGTHDGTTDHVSTRPTLRKATALA
ncbi:methylaspartate mutase [Streptomyces puniciscabiei]|uniref:methylaspartate mutase n=1 Tax=Streptomyces puniciscabiei TaxID=164348 RepID=UPI003329C71B